MALEVAERLVEMYSFWGDVVLDPFAGTGTTLKAAQKLGRNYVGYELYEYYKNVIEKNLGIIEEKKMQPQEEIKAEITNQQFREEFPF